MTPASTHSRSTKVMPPEASRMRTRGRFSWSMKRESGPCRRGGLGPLDPRRASLDRASSGESPWVRSVSSRVVTWDSGRACQQVELFERYGLTWG